MYVHVDQNHPLVRWMRTRRGTFVTACVFCVAFTLLATFLVPIGVRQAKLTGDAPRATAEVLETKVFGGHEKNKTQRNPTVRYRFFVGDKEYGYAGPTGGQYADVSQQVMDGAAKAGTIDVIYQRDDPTNNLPAAKQNWLMAWVVGLLVVPTTVALCMWAWVVKVVWRELKLRTGATSAEMTLR
jgi:hypothetical protein